MTSAMAWNGLWSCLFTKYSFLDNRHLPALNDPSWYVTYWFNILVFHSDILSEPRPSLPWGEKWTRVTHCWNMFWGKAFFPRSPCVQLLAGGTVFGKEGKQCILIMLLGLWCVCLPIKPWPCLPIQSGSSVVLKSLYQFRQPKRGECELNTTNLISLFPTLLLFSHSGTLCFSKLILIYESMCVCVVFKAAIL
jgi:hypothetical protein